MASREELHREIDSLNDLELARARIVLVDQVGADTSVASILARQGEHRLGAEQFAEHFGDLPRDGEG
ncbi:MAG: hypothetical protein ACR2LK_14380 [Solirubrobacteraceae bacterium]